MAQPQKSSPLPSLSISETFEKKKEGLKKKWFALPDHEKALLIVFLIVIIGGLGVGIWQVVKLATKKKPKGDGKYLDEGIKMKASKPGAVKGIEDGYKKAQTETKKFVSAVAKTKAVQDTKNASDAVAKKAQEASEAATKKAQEAIEAAAKLKAVQDAKAKSDAAARELAKSKAAEVANKSSGSISKKMKIKKTKKKKLKI
jgi:hypothetical protein